MPIPVPRCLPYIPRGLAWDQTRASVVTGQQQTACAMTWFVAISGAHVMGNVTLSSLPSIFYIFCFFVITQYARYEIFWDLTLHHITEGLIPHLHQCRNLKTCILVTCPFNSYTCLHKFSVVCRVSILPSLNNKREDTVAKKVKKWHDTQIITILLNNNPSRCLSASSSFNCMHLKFSVTFFKHIFQ
jgi:hypothetical protein